MPFNRELSINIICFLLFIFGVISTGLWMAGYLEHYRVSYTRFSEPLTETKIENIQISHTESQVLNKPEAEMIDAESKQIFTILEHEELPINDSETRRVVSIASKPLDIEYDLIALEKELDWSDYKPKKVIATGYTAGFESTGKKPGDPQYGITYSGVQVRRDLFSTIAADLSLFPLGTILYIPNYGYGVVADKGGAIRGEKIDLYFKTVDDVYKLWGKQEVEVYLIQEGQGFVTEVMLDELNDSVQVFKSKKLYR